MAILTSSTNPRAPIRVLVVDDSALMRQMLSTMLASDPDVEVVGTASDPLIARQKIKQFDPDVVTLDIEMPNMHGLEFLRRLMALRPTRVLMISSLTQKNTEFTLEALASGAVDCLGKPRDATSELEMAGFRETLLQKIHAVASARLRSAPAVTAGVPLQVVPGRTRRHFIAFGASTGGVEALSRVFAELPSGLPPIAVVQHMPGGFTSSFARRLANLSQIEVVEAEDGMPIRAGQAALGPGGYQFEIVRRDGEFRCRVFEGPAPLGHAPSVDILMESVALAVGDRAIGVILTGMGRDGARGMSAMRAAGALTIGQDEASSLVYGMPRVAFEAGGVEQQSPLARVAAEVIAAVQSR
ncbi:MAG TPA: chemotaxis response regulator protein-glutamate methylesterase [Rhabdaerophilum sp.]|nr:chemotaxis response regulator protein-glutamate methylesterase [Rhabdaerophilum sp.]